MLSPHHSFGCSTWSVAMLADVFPPPTLKISVLIFAFDLSAEEFASAKHFLLLEQDASKWSSCSAQHCRDARNNIQTIQPKGVQWKPECPDIHPAHDASLSLCWYLGLPCQSQRQSSIETGIDRMSGSKLSASPLLAFEEAVGIVEDPLSAMQMSTCQV